MTLTYCHRGHKFTEENTYWHDRNGKPTRDCRRCKSIRERLRLAENATIRARWSDEELSVLNRMVQAGATSAKIAKALGRTVNSVRSARELRRINRPLKRPIVPVRASEPRETEIISKSDVEAFYELGWRFVGFSGFAHFYVFEWPSGHRPPQWPEQRRAA